MFLSYELFRQPYQFVLSFDDHYEHYLYEVNMEMTNTGQQQMPGMKAMMYMSLLS